jgi:hypothetical protein
VRSAKKTCAVAVVFLCAVGYVLSPFVVGLSRGGPVTKEVLLARQRKAREWSWLLALSYAIQGYAGENQRCLPYHAGGPEKALYTLKPYALPDCSPWRPKGAEMFDAQDPDADVKGRAYFDDVNERVVNADYDYISLSGLRKVIRRQRGPQPGPEETSLIILAERDGVRKGSKRYLTITWEVGEYRFRPGESADIVGRPACFLGQRGPSGPAAGRSGPERN